MINGAQANALEAAISRVKAAAQAEGLTGAQVEMVLDVFEAGIRAGDMTNCGACLTAIVEGWTAAPAPPPAEPAPEPSGETEPETTEEED